MSGKREKGTEWLDPQQVVRGALTAVVALALAGCGGAATSEVKTAPQGDARTMMAPQDRQGYEEAMKKQRGGGGPPGISPGGPGGGMPPGGMPPGMPPGAPR